MIARLLVIFLVLAGLKANPLNPIPSHLVTNAQELAQLTINNDARLTAVESKQALHSAHCGFQTSWNTPKQAVTYLPKLLEDVDGGTGSTMDPNTGIWTAGLRGTYLVSWNLYSRLSAGKHNELYLTENRSTVRESLHSSYIDRDTNGYINEQGGRTLVSPSPPSPAAQIRQLDRGDALSLYAERLEATVGQITFCVTLLHAT